MISNDEIFKELKESRKENNDAHKEIFARMNCSDERLTRVEEKQKTIWGVMITIGGAIVAIVVSWVSGLFGGNK